MAHIAHRETIRAQFGVGQRSARLGGTTHRPCTLNDVPKIKRMRARRVQPSDGIRVADTLAAPDYVDAFEVSTGGPRRSAEQWARATFEDAPAAVRWLLLIGWRFVLGFRLGPRPSPAHILGWDIVRSTPEVIVLGVRSIVLGQAHLVFHVERATVVVATSIRFERRAASAVWSVLGVIHRTAMWSLLTRAAAQCPAPSTTSVTPW